MQTQAFGQWKPLAGGYISSIEKVRHHACYDIFRSCLSPAGYDVDKLKNCRNILILTFSTRFASSWHGKELGNFGRQLHNNAPLHDLQYKTWDLKIIQPDTLSRKYRRLLCLRYAHFVQNEQKKLFFNVFCIMHFYCCMSWFQSALQHVTCTTPTGLLKQELTQLSGKQTRLHILHI